MSPPSSANHAATSGIATNEVSCDNRGKKYNLEKTAHGGDRKSKDQSDTLIDCASALAAEFKVSTPTIKRDGKFTECLDTLTEQTLPLNSPRLPHERPFVASPALGERSAFLGPFLAIFEVSHMTATADPMIASFARLVVLHSRLSGRDPDEQRVEEWLSARWADVEQDMNPVRWARLLPLL